MLTPRAPSCYDRGDPRVRWLFEDPTAAATDYYRRTGIFPIMHLTGLRRELAEQHPWLPGALLKAFTQAKAVSQSRLGDTAATKVTLPFVEERLREARQQMGADFWSYGLAANQQTLDVFLRHHHTQGLSPRTLRPPSSSTRERTRAIGSDPVPAVLRPGFSLGNPRSCRYEGGGQGRSRAVAFRRGLNDWRFVDPKDRFSPVAAASVPRPGGLHAIPSQRLRTRRSGDRRPRGAV